MFEMCRLLLRCFQSFPDCKYGLTVDKFHVTNVDSETLTIWND